jgi:hypothetical protein
MAHPLSLKLGRLCCASGAVAQPVALIRKAQVRHPGRTTSRPWDHWLGCHGAFGLVGMGRVLLLKEEPLAPISCHGPSDFSETNATFGWLFLGGRKHVLGIR